MLVSQLQNLGTVTVHEGLQYVVVVDDVVDVVVVTPATVEPFDSGQYSNHYDVHKYLSVLL